MEIGVPLSLLTAQNVELAFNDFSVNPTSLSGVITPYAPGVGNGYLIQKITGLDGAPIRNPMDSRPHKSGGIGHAFLRDFRVFTIEGIVMAETNAIRTAMEDKLRGVAESLMKDQGRCFFIPSGQATRFLEVKHYEAVENSDFPFGLSGPHGFQITFVADRPYPLTYTQIVTNLPDGIATAVGNAGNAETWPVVKVFGPSSGFTLQRADGTNITWTGTLGAGVYIEIDMFKETMYNNGDEADRLGGLDLENSDFFPIPAGGDTLTVTNATASVLANAAWA
jgi:phage-related protein